jgi:hypothetical protein
MSRDYWMPTPEPMPDLKPGDVLLFEPDELRYHDRRVRLRLERVRDDLSFYEDAVWLEGLSLSADGSPSGRTQVLALRSAISRALQRGAPPPLGNGGGY